VGCTGDDGLESVLARDLGTEERSGQRMFKKKKKVKARRRFVAAAVMLGSAAFGAHSSAASCLALDVCAAVRSVAQSIVAYRDTGHDRSQAHSIVDAITPGRANQDIAHAVVDFVYGTPEADGAYVAEDVYAA